MARRAGRRRERTPEDRRRLRRRLGWATLCTLLLLEVGLRFVLGNFAQSRMLMRSDDPEICLENTPGVELTYTGWLLKVAPSQIRINAMGGRGAEIGPRDDRLRVIALGDSFTFGQGVQEEQAFPEVVARVLTAAARPVEMLNFGVPGHGQPQSVALLAHKLIELAPDLVLIHVFANDLSAEDSYCLRGRGSVPLARWMLLNVYTARLAYVLASPLRRVAPPMRAVNLGTPEERYVQALREAQSLGAAHGFAVVVVLLTNRGTYMDTRFCRGCTPPHDLTAQTGLPIVDLSATWEQLQTDIPRYFIAGDDHLNADGNAVLGEALAAALLEWPGLPEPRR